MKKTGIVVGLLVLILILGWVGGTYAISNKAEAEMDQMVEMANETTNAQWDFLRIEKSEFEKGFASSTAKTAIFPSGKDVAEDEKFFLNHTIYHGPLAMTPDGPKVCEAYMISVIDWSSMDEDDLEEMKNMFGEAEPLTIRTTRKMGGGEEIEMEIAPAKFAEDEMKGKFGGMTGTMVMNAERTKFSGDFEAAVSEMTFPGEEGSMKMHPSSADFSYTKGKLLKANLKIGAVDGVIENGTMNFTESIGLVDIKDDSHFKVDLKLGDLTMISPPGEDFKMSASGLVFTADFSRIDEDSLITVGKGELRAPNVKVDTEGSSVSLSDFRVGVESGVEAEKLFGQVEYGFGGIKMEGPEFEGAEEFGGVLENGASLSFGIRGIDRQVVESFYQVIEAAEEKSTAKATDLEALAPELAETFSNNLFNFFQPGLEIFYELLIGKEDEGVGASFSLKMKGEKRLDELKTGREIVNAIEGKLHAEMAKSFLPDETMQMMMLEYVQQGMIQAKADQSGYEFNGDLTNGVLHLAGEATPLLESFGPMLDESIPWDEIKSGMSEGMQSGVEDAVDAATRGAAETGAEDADADDGESE